MKLSLSQKLAIGGYMLRSLVTKPLFPAYKPRSLKFLEDPYPTLMRMRDERPVFWSPHTLGWHVSGTHAELTQWLRDDRLSLSFRNWMFAPQSEAHSELDKVLDNLLMSLAPADHMRVRRLVSPAFSPRYVAAARPEIEQMVQRRLDECDRAGEIDMVTLCREIPIDAMAIYFGIPPSARTDFADLGHAIISAFDSSSQPDVAGAERGIAQLRRQFEEKRKQPDDTFMSTLINHIEEGERITENEALALVGSLLAAGVDTTFDYMLHIFYALAKNPQWGPWLAEHPEQVQAVMDESLRWNSFGHRGFFRFALEDLEIQGQKIKRGEIVQIMMSIGNWDPEVFPEPEQFNPLRTNLEKSMPFGVGAHYCLGHAIAKLIGQVTTLAVIQRYPHLSTEGEPTREYNMVSRRMTRFIVKGQNTPRQSTAPSTKREEQVFA